MTQQQKKKMSNISIQIDDLEECASQALFFLDQLRANGENLIYKNAARQFVGDIKRQIKDARDSVQSTSPPEST